MATPLITVNKLIDLRSKLRRMALKEGQNLVAARGAIKLFAKVVDNRLVDLEAIDSNGKRIPLVRKKGRVQDGAEMRAFCRVCWIDDGVEYCYELPVCVCRSGCQLPID